MTSDPVMSTKPLDLAAITDRLDSFMDSADLKTDLVQKKKRCENFNSKNLGVPNTYL